jgi:hypothetical protein
VLRDGKVLARICTKALRAGRELGPGCLFIGFKVYITIWPVVSEVISKDTMSFVRYQIFIGAIFFFLPFIFVLTASSILLSHRIAGPLYRIELTLDKLIQGEEVGHIPANNP